MTSLLQPDLVLGDIRIIYLTTLASVLSRTKIDPDLVVPFLNSINCPIVRWPSAEWVDYDTLQMCLGAALSPCSPNLVIPPATPPASTLHHWRYRLTPDDISKVLHYALLRLLVSKGAKPKDLRPDLLLRACRRFLLAGDGLRPLLHLKISDDDILAALNRHLSHTPLQVSFTSGDPLTPTIQRDPRDEPPT